MKKIKKYVYPFAFSIGFFLFYIVVAILINLFFSDNGGYGGLGLALFILAVWLLVVIPVYCVMYYKLIREEKLSLLFGFYNPLVISLCYTSPFIISAGPSSRGIMIGIAVALFGWAAVWTIMPLILRRERQIAVPQEKRISFDNDQKNRYISICAFLLIVTTIVFAIVSVLRPNFTSLPLDYICRFVGWRLLELGFPVLILVYLHSLHKEYLIQKWLLPTAFLLEIIQNISILQSCSLDLSLADLRPVRSIMWIFSSLLCLASLLVFIGTLFEFKYIRLLQWGTVGCIGCIGISLITNVIFWHGWMGSAVLIPLSHLVRMLLYVGLFALIVPQKADCHKKIADIS